MYNQCACCEDDLTVLLSQAGQPPIWPAHFACTLDDFGDRSQCLGPEDPSSLEDDTIATTTSSTAPTTAGEPCNHGCPHFSRNRSTDH